MRYFDANGLENEKQTIEMKSAENAKYNYGATILEQDLADCPYGLNLYVHQRARDFRQHE